MCSELGAFMLWDLFLMHTWTVCKSGTVATVAPLLAAAVVVGLIEGALWRPVA